ncbi:hypothetical protein UPYG_G00243120 [Umbra pygmaea]|uniref:SEA domain-containing protein n=1 Tax=Umbra pygmaea TaxID=75934 RepID=A0ABD0WFR0_UMBPY
MSRIKVTARLIILIAYNNRESGEFKNLALTITTVFDVIYKTKYGTLFIRTIVVAFIQIGRSRALSNETQAQIELVFNHNASKPIPQITDIGNTLTEALTNNNSVLGNLSVDVNSITIKAVDSQTSTPVITTALIPTTTTTTTTTAVALTTVIVEFRSIKENFISDLSNISSLPFINRALLIQSQIEPLYRLNFVSFKSLNITKFRSGSIINTMNLNFPSSSVPNNLAIANVLIKAAGTVTGFDIDTTSVSVTGPGFGNSGVNSKASLFTASCLVVLSLLLSRHQ